MITKEQIKTELNKLDCGDSSCLFSGSKGGMRTNGGCRCISYHQNDHQIRKILQMVQILVNE